MVGINSRGQSVEYFSEYHILREALANQMAHAVHFSTLRSSVHVFDDCIEFINPVGMPKPLEVMERTFESQPRNPVISKLFRLAHLSENLGYGLQKLKQWEAIPGMQMHKNVSMSAVKVVFGLRAQKSKTVNVGVNVGVKLTDPQYKVLALIKESPSLTHAKIPQTLSVSVRTAERTTQSLRKLYLIERDGSDKTGGWRLSQQTISQADNFNRQFQELKTKI